MLNWKTRYHKILRDNPDLRDPDHSILEVGGGASGLAAYLDRKITSLDKEFPERIHHNIMPVIGSIDAIFYPDDSFDSVVCVDVLEHIDEDKRQIAVTEMIRVARQKVIISYPCRDFAEQGEFHLKTLLERTLPGVPSWLEEHIRHGLPSLADIAGAIISSGHVFTITPNEGFIQHYSGIILDMLFPVVQSRFQRLEEKSPAEPPIYENEWDDYYSFIFTVKKERIPESPKSLPSSRPAKAHSAIYSVYHETLPTDHLDTIIPIYVGKAAGQVSAANVTDRLSDGSSLDNERWSELSAVYRIWKEGPRSDIVGFTHYRRLFQSESGLREVRVRQREIGKYRIDDAMFADLENDFIIIPSEIKLVSSTFNHYCAAHNANHICLMYDILRDIRPDLLPSAAIQFRRHGLYANNMFITSWKNFDEICQLWFSVLPLVAEAISAESATRYQKRDLSFLAERLFDLWILHKKAAGAPVIETGIYFLEFDNLDVGAWSQTR